MNNHELEGRLAVLEVTLAVMLAGVTKGHPHRLDEFHEKLSNLIRDAASDVAAQHGDVPEAEQMMFVEAACDQVDKLVIRARAAQ